MARVENSVHAGNAQEVVRQLQADLIRDLRSIHGGDRASKRIDLDYLDRTYEKMAAEHTSKSWKHTINFIGSVFGVAGAALGKDDRMGILLSAIGQTTSQAGQWALTFNEAQMSRLQGHMEQLRDALQQDNKDDQEVQNLIREIDQIINQALEKMARANNSPFTQ